MVEEVGAKVAVVSVVVVVVVVVVVWVKESLEKARDRDAWLVMSSMLGSWESWDLRLGGV